MMFQRQALAYIRGREPGGPSGSAGAGPPGPCSEPEADSQPVQN